MELVKAVFIGAVLIAGFIMLPVVIAAITVLADMRLTVAIRRCPKSAFREKCLKADHLFAPQITVAGADRQRVIQKLSIRLQATSGFAV